MKIFLLILLDFVFITSVKPQSVNAIVKIFSQEEYKKFFPIETQIALFTPTTDYVCILPTNEKDTILQREVNEYYKNSFIKKFPTIPNQICRIITDKEALHTDLSQVNIHAFGTIEGNLWITQFINKEKDFPIKIYKDSVVANKRYIGNDFFVTALWYNPTNFKHSVTVYIPQKIECAKSVERRNSAQFTIWQNGKKVGNSNYFLRGQNWYFSDVNDTMLVFRDVNHNMRINLDKIDAFYYRYPTTKQLESCLIK